MPRKHQSINGSTYRLVTLTSHDQSRSNFASSIDNGRLRTVHVQTPHVAQLLQQAHADKPFRGESTHGSIMARRADHDRSSDDVWVHAGLRIVVKCNEGPVRHDARNALPSLEVFSDDEVLNGSCVHEDDVRHGKNTRQDGGSEKCSVFDNNEGTFILVRDTNLLKKAIGGFANDLSPCETGKDQPATDHVP